MQVQDQELGLICCTARFLAEYLGRPRLKVEYLLATFWPVLLASKSELLTNRSHRDTFKRCVKKSFAGMVIIHNDARAVLLLLLLLHHHLARGL